MQSAYPGVHRPTPPFQAEATDTPRRETAIANRCVLGARLTREDDTVETTPSNDRSGTDRSSQFSYHASTRFTSEEHAVTNQPWFTPLSRSHAALLVVVTLMMVVLAPAVEAMYHPGLGRFLQRDPIGTSLVSTPLQRSTTAFVAADNPSLIYAGGMNLYARPTGTFTSLDPSGLIPIELEFNAFIPSWIGRSMSSWWGSSYASQSGNWFQPPGHVQRWLVNTDDRGFGGGKSRIYSRGTIESSEIGNLESKEGSIFTTGSDPTVRVRRPWFGTSLVTQSATSAPREIEEVEDISHCESIVRVWVGGKYPFSGLFGTQYGNVAPSINYEAEFKLRKDEPDGSEGFASLSGGHNNFPAYEGRIRSDWVYSYNPTSTSNFGPGIWNLGFAWTNFTAPITVGWDY